MRGHLTRPPAWCDGARDSLLDVLGEVASPKASRRRAPRGVQVLLGDGNRPWRLGFAAAELSTAVEKRSGIRVPDGDPRVERRGGMMNRAQAECVYQAKI